MAEPRLGDWLTGMQRQAVESSTLASIGYDEGLGVLEVEFKNGRVYQYFMVPAALYEQLLSSTSKGSFYLEEIRGKFPYREFPP